MEINQELFDSTIDHAVDVKLFEESVQVGNNRIIRRHKEKLLAIVKADLAGPLVDKKKSFNSLKAEQSRFATELFSWQKTNMTELSTAELDFSSNLLNKSARGFYEVERPKVREILSPITGSVMKGEKTLKGNISNITAGELVRVQTKIKSGQARKLTPNEILKEVDATTRITSSQTSTITRTAITSTQRDSLVSTLEANASLVKGFMFSAILDTRTSSICSFHNGKVYSVDNKSFMPPLHFNCRSTMVPVLRSKEELQGNVEDLRIKQEGLSKVSDGFLSGVTAAKENLSEWLKRQSFPTQVKMLGDEFRVKLFREGKLLAEEFITPKGLALSITALRKRAASAVSIYKPRQELREETTKLSVFKPSELVNKPENRVKVRELFLLDSDDYNKTYALTDFKGTSLQGKQTARRRVGNEFDPSNNSFDPLTGEAKNNNLYDPNYTLFQERLDFMRNSKTLKAEHKSFIEDVVNGIEDKVSINQQTVAIENLRVVIERALSDGQPWDNLASVLRAENRFSVQNVSRLLDVRQRNDNELFAKFTGKAEDSLQVQIMGKYYDLDSLQANRLKDQRFIDDFRRTTGKELATELYLKGKLPARAYFSNLAGQYPTTKKVKKWLIANTTVGRAYTAYKKFGEPKDDWWVTQVQTLNENYRYIVDLEFLRVSKKPSSDFLDDSAINSLSKAVKLVASGQMTDYDGLAIAIGKQFAKDFENILPFTKHTMKDYHKEGSKILEFMLSSKMIRTNFRGKVRRGVYDVDTGRSSSSWGDTISREVEVLDKRMIALQEAERRTVIARRLGIVEERDRLIVKANKKTYFDARGNDTGIPIISRNKAASYDATQIDSDIANMMNHAMDVEYEVDPEFFSFMDDLVRFRDPRGNSKYYDGINEFRHEVLARGDQGYGLMTTAKWHAQRGKPFKTEVYLDSRGRVYHRGYLTPTGGEMVRPFLNDARAVSMTPQALREIRIQTGAMIGESTEALTQTGRLEIFARNEKSILELGQLLMSKTQRDRRLREFLEHPLIQKLEGPEVPKLARLSLEYARVHKHNNGDFLNSKLLSTYKTKLMVENDASASGAQIIGLSTRDRMISEASNVVATTKKNRLYDLVAMDTIDDPEFLKIPALRDANLTWGDLAKAAKSQNLVSFYGAGANTKTANVAREFAKVLEKKGIMAITKESLAEQLRIIDTKIKLSNKIGATVVEAELKNFREELLDLVNKDQSVAIKLMKEAEEISEETAAFVAKLMNNRGGLVGPEDFKKISEIMSKNLSARAPVTDNFIQFWKLAAKSYVKDTNSVDIPWITFDGKLMTQKYRPQLQERIEFKDPVTGRKVMNIYQMEAQDGKLLGKGSIADATIGLGVNGNHSNDASIVRQFHLWGRKNNLSTATIHDAFFTNVAVADKAISALKVIYADSLDSNTIKDTLKAMRKKGMSQKTYEILLSEARKAGLIDVRNPLTREDILKPIPEGMDYYGIGP